MIQSGEPTVMLAYVCVTNGQNSLVLAERFVETYRRFPPGYPHQVTVICNGGVLGAWHSRIFANTGFKFFVRGNDGWDIGGFIEFAKKCKSDCLLCLGESVHFHRPGWLAKIADAWMTYGPGMYGCFSSYLTRPHLNTTAFAIAPPLLAAYDKLVVTREDRYEFEHGPSAMWRQVAWSGKPAYLVTWSGVYGHADWRKPNDILWKGDQSNCLVFCNHTQRYMLAPAATKKNWELGANSRRKTVLV